MAHPNPPNWYLNQSVIDSTIAFIEETVETGTGPFFSYVSMPSPHAPIFPTDAQLAPQTDLGHGAPNQYARFKGLAEVYFSVIAGLDNDIGRLLDLLDELGIADDTIVIFTSDNGPEVIARDGIKAAHMAAGSNIGPFRGAKRSLYEGGIRMPFLARGPGIPAGIIDTTTVMSTIDL